MVLVERTVGGQPAPYLEPVHGKDDSQVGWMSGGAFASAFSGFASKVGFYGAVAVHDRQEVYRAMD